jgi:hypothetical protein
MSLNGFALGPDRYMVEQDSSVLLGEAHPFRSTNVYVYRVGGK